MHPSDLSRRDHLPALVRASATLAALPAGAGPEAIYDALYALARDLLGIQDFIVARFEVSPAVLRCVAAVADGAPCDPLRMPPLPLGSGPVSTVVRSGEPVIIGDIRAGRTDWIKQEVGEGPPVRSVLFVPMTRGGAVTGVVQAQSPRVNAFTLDDAAALSILANQAAAALDASSSAARARILDEVGRLVNASLDHKQVLAALTGELAAVIGGGCAVYLLSADGTSYEDRLLRYRDSRLAALNAGVFNRIPAQVTDTFIGRTIVAGKPLYIADIAASGLEPELREGALALGIREALFAPILHGVNVLGSVMVMGTDRYPLDKADLPLVIAVAGRAAAAIERAELYERVATKAAELSAVIAAMTEGVLALQPDGRVRLLNPAGRRMLGERALPPGTEVWRSLAALKPRHPDGTAMSATKLRRLLLTEHPQTDAEVLVRGPDGADRLLRVNAAPLVDGSVAVFEDITDRRALENAREDFLAQASHELRTPLTSLLGYLQMAERRVQREGATPLVREAVTGAVTQTQRLRGLVTDLLEAIRIRQGRLPLHPAPMDLRLLVTATASERAEHERESDGLHLLALDVPDAPVTGTWDEQRLRQVLVNLLDNAIKYSPGGGKVLVRLSVTDETAAIAVRDEGIGIPLVEQPKLFRPFGRAAHPAAQNIPGFGMGLYIARDIVERHRGTLTLESQPGEGSTFTVRLPRTEP